MYAMRHLVAKLFLNFFLPNRQQTPCFDTSSNTLMYKEQLYIKNSAVMLIPNSLNVNGVRKKRELYKARNLESKDPTVYTEYWRKKMKKQKKSDISDPFDIGIIEDIFEDKDDNVMIRVRCLYRPENIGLNREEIGKQDINKV